MPLGRSQSVGVSPGACTDPFQFDDHEEPVASTPASIGGCTVALAVPGAGGTVGPKGAKDTKGPKGAKGDRGSKGKAAAAVAAAGVGHAASRTPAVAPAPRGDEFSFPDDGSQSPVAPLPSSHHKATSWAAVAAGVTPGSKRVRGHGLVPSPAPSPSPPPAQRPRQHCEARVGLLMQSPSAAAATPALPNGAAAAYATPVPSWPGMSAAAAGVAADSLGKAGSLRPPGLSAHAAGDASAGAQGTEAGARGRPVGMSGPPGLKTYASKRAAATAVGLPPRLPSPARVFAGAVLSEAPGVATRVAATTPSDPVWAEAATASAAPPLRKWKAQALGLGVPPGAGKGSAGKGAGKGSAGKGSAGRRAGGKVAAPVVSPSGLSSSQPVAAASTPQPLALLAPTQTPSATPTPASPPPVLVRTAPPAFSALAPPPPGPDAPTLPAWVFGASAPTGTAHPLPTAMALGDSDDGHSGLLGGGGGGGLAEAGSDDTSVGAGAGDGAGDGEAAAPTPAPTPTLPPPVPKRMRGRGWEYVLEAVEAPPSHDSNPVCTDRRRSKARAQAKAKGAAAAAAPTLPASATAAATTATSAAVSAAVAAEAAGLAPAAEPLVGEGRGPGRAKDGGDPKDRAHNAPKRMRGKGWEYVLEVVDEAAPALPAAGAGSEGNAWGRKSRRRASAGAQRATERAQASAAAGAGSALDLTPMLANASLGARDANLPAAPPAAVSRVGDASMCHNVLGVGGDADVLGVGGDADVLGVGGDADVAAEVYGHAGAAADAGEDGDDLARAAPVETTVGVQAGVDDAPSGASMCASRAGADIAEEGGDVGEAGAETEVEAGVEEEASGLVYADVDPEEAEAEVGVGPEGEEEATARAAVARGAGPVCAGNEQEPAGSVGPRRPRSRRRVECYSDSDDAGALGVGPGDVAPVEGGWEDDDAAAGAASCAGAGAGAGAAAAAAESTGHLPAPGATTEPAPSAGGSLPAQLPAQGVGLVTGPATAASDGSADTALLVVQTMESVGIAAARAAIAAAPSPYRAATAAAVDGGRGSHGAPRGHAMHPGQAVEGEDGGGEGEGEGEGEAAAARPGPGPGAAQLLVRFQGDAGGGGGAHGGTRGQGRAWSPIPGTGTAARGNPLPGSTLRRPGGHTVAAHP
jgi:hypothetical protein